MRKTKLFMDTMVDIQVVTQKAEEKEVEEKINRAFLAFQRVEEASSRFSPSSELMKACQDVGRPVKISPYLFEPLFFAVQIARMTNGLFDPTVGKVMEEYGFNRHYLTGSMIHSPSAETVTYQDILLSQSTRTLTIMKPLVIDLGAVAKGFAIDVAAQELIDFEGFVINAGGDIFAGGLNDKGSPWEIGIQHPYHRELLVETIKLSNEAICTSGSYERKNQTIPSLHHILNPNTKSSPNQLVSSSIVAPFAMMADAFSTVVFLLGEDKGKEVIEELNLKGMLITPELKIIRAGGM